GGEQTTERDVRLVVDGLVVDVHDPGGDPAGQLQAAHHVAGQDAQGQAVLAVGGELGRVLGGGERHHRGHRAEHLVGVGRHGRGHVGQHGRPVEQPLVGAARGQPATGVHGGGDQVVHLVPLPLVDDRAQRDRLLGRVTDRQVAGLVGQPAHVLVVDGLL